MGKIAFVFSGQGAQYTGMGKELYDNFQCVKRVYDQGNEILNFDIKNLCFCGPETELNKTEITQPAILLTSLAISSIMDENNIHADYAAGLSLGEYSALIYGNVFSLEDGLRLIKKRGKIMQEAVPQGQGAMAAIMGTDRETIKNYCDKYSGDGVLEIANYNCPGQIVITGESEFVKKAVEDLKELGASRTIMLNVSGPFHSSLMKNAGKKLNEELCKVSIGCPSIKVISNYDNEYYGGNRDNTIFKLTNQISSSVLWEDNIKTLIKEGVETFIELGPGRALSSFIKKIDRSKTVINIEDIKSLEKSLHELNK